MPRRFRLDKVLAARRVVEQRRKQDLAAADRALVRERAVLARLHEQFAVHRNQALQPPQGRLDIQREAALRAVLQQLGEAARRQAAAVTQCEVRVEASRAALVKAARARRVLENLEERHQQAVRQEDDAREQLTMDEIARQTAVRGEVTGMGAHPGGGSREETP